MQNMTQRSCAPQQGVFQTSIVERSCLDPAEARLCASLKIYCQDQVAWSEPTDISGLWSYGRMHDENRVKDLYARVPRGSR